MVLSNSKSMHTRIQNSRILIQCLQSYSSQIEINSINSTIRNRLLLQLFISEMIHAKQWHYSLQQRLPEASFHSFYTKNPRNSSSTNSTPGRQRALRVILHAEGKEIFYPVYKAFQPQDLPQAFQFYKDIPVISDISDIPVYPVLPGIPPVPAFLQIECKIYTSIGFHQKLH